MPSLRADPRVLTEAHRRILHAAARAHERYGDVQLRLEGGTALSAYYLHHRESEDLDLFGAGGLHADAFATTLAEELARRGVEASRVAGGEGFAEWVVDGVRVHIARTSPFRLEDPLPTEEGVPVASFRDLAAGKLHAVCDRFEARDFIDIHSILTRPDESDEPPSPGRVGDRARRLVRDVIESDPGLNPVTVGQALARGLDRQIIGGFPLRLLAAVDDLDVQRTLHTAVESCARLARERMTE